METLLKMKYVVPEVEDFKWVSSLGKCHTGTCSGDGSCSIVGNTETQISCPP